MEAAGGAGAGCDGASNRVAKKPRSNTLRRPRLETHAPVDARPASSSSGVGNNAGGEGLGLSREVFLVNLPVSSRRVGRAADDAVGKERVKTDDCSHQEAAGNFYKRKRSRGNVLEDYKRPTEGVLAPANWNRRGDSVNHDTHSGGVDGGIERCGDFHATVGFALGAKGDTPASEQKLKRVMLKGVWQTTPSSLNSVGVSDGSCPKPSHTSNASHLQRELNIQGNSDSDPLRNQDNGSERGLTRLTNLSIESVHRSKRVPKKRALDEAFYEGEEDEERRYRGKLKTAKFRDGVGTRNVDEEQNDKKQKNSETLRTEIGLGNHGDVKGFDDSSRKSMQSKKLNPKVRTRDADNMEDKGNYADFDSDDGVGGKRKQPEKEISLTARQRALRSVTHKSADAGSNAIEFPNGLPPAPQRKQKVSEAEKQLKKVEAAQRRRIQMEKATKESEAAAIRKILGQDSNRNKRADKEQKRREEMAKVKAARAAACNVRWVIGPTGTVVSFPESVGLPSIFDSKKCSYPPPREKCAGPSCTNPCRYRHSKSNLPLCSLECYKTVNGMPKPVTIS